MVFKQVGWRSLGWFWGLRCGDFLGGRELGSVEEVQVFGGKFGLMLVVG